jgi:flagellin-like hook-associated protein FlgL
MINKAEDGAARLSIATKLDARVSGLNVALNNVSDTKSMLDIADDAYQQTSDQLIELKSLAIQAASDTIGDQEREYIGRQMEQLGDEINTIANQAVFQDVELLNGKDSAFIHPRQLTIQDGERSGDYTTIELAPVNLTELFKGSNNLIGTTSRSYTNRQFYAGISSLLDQNELRTVSETSPPSALETNTGETAEKILIDVNGTSYSTTISGYTETPDAGDLSQIESAINTLGVPGLSALEKDGELLWMNTSNQTIDIQIVDQNDNTIGIPGLSLDPAETIEKVRVDVGGSTFEGDLIPPQSGESDIDVFADAIRGLGISGLRAVKVNGLLNPDELGILSTSFEDISVTFLNSDGNQANINTVSMPSPKADQITLTGPDGTYTAPITEYSGYPDEESMHEFEAFINSLELEGFLAEYDQDFDRLIINNATDDQFFLDVTSTTSGDPGISVKLSEPPTELHPQGKLYFGRAGNDLATGDELRMFIREVDGAIEDLNEKMTNLGSIQKSLTNREELLSSSIISNSAAYSRLMDADFAREQSRLIRLQIMQQTSNSALSQANFGPRAVLGLFGN